MIFTIAIHQLNKINLKKTKLNKIKLNFVILLNSGHYLTIQGKNQPSANCELSISFVFSRITLRAIYREICESKLSFSQNFCFLGNHEVSLHFKLYIKLCLNYSKKCQTVQTFLEFGYFFGIQAPNTFQLLELLTKFSRITSEKIIQTLPYQIFPSKHAGGKITSLKEISYL